MLACITFFSFLTSITYYYFYYTLVHIIRISTHTGYLVFWFLCSVFHHHHHYNSRTDFSDCRRLVAFNANGVGLPAWSSGLAGLTELTTQLYKPFSFDYHRHDKICIIQHFSYFFCRNVGIKLCRFCVVSQKKIYYIIAFMCMPCCRVWSG